MMMLLKIKIQKMMEKGVTSNLIDQKILRYYAYLLCECGTSYRTCLFHNRG